VALAAIGLLGLLLRIVPLTYSHFWDETVFLQNALVVLDGRTNYDEWYYRPPLLSFAYALGFALWDSLYVANIVQGLLAMTAVAGGYLFTRSVAGARAGMIAAFLFAFTPSLVEFSHQLLTDMPGVGLMLLSLWLFQGRRRTALVLSGTVYALAVLMRFNSVFLGVYFVLLVAFYPGRIRDLLLFSVAAALTIAPYLIWTQARFGNFLYPFRHAHDIVTRWTAHNPVSMYVEGFFDIFPPIVLTGFAVGIAVAGYRFATARKETPNESDAMADTAARHQIVLLLWGVLFFVHMAIIPHKEVRYLLPLAIPVMTLSAAGFASMSENWRQRGRVTGMALAGLFGVLLARDIPPAFGKLLHPWIDASKDQNVRIAEFIRASSPEGGTIYAATWFPALAFYSGMKTVSTLPIQEGFDQKWRGYMNAPGYFVWYRMGSNFEDHSKYRVLQPGLGFLDSHEEFQRIGDFESAVVYRYTPEK
jgi:4-amino-4-deoxy-L-arabinose transferase-like glycosyltransferase